jgi:hypothetical protein
MIEKESSEKEVRTDRKIESKKAPNTQATAANQPANMNKLHSQEILSSELSRRV